MKVQLSPRGKYKNFNKLKKNLFFLFLVVFSGVASFLNVILDLLNEADGVFFPSWFFRAAEQCLKREPLTASAHFALNDRPLLRDEFLHTCDCESKKLQSGRTCWFFQ